MEQFSVRCKLALEFFRTVLISDYRGIYLEWQKKNPQSFWTLNNAWDMCYFCCISRYVAPDEAAKAADWAATQNFWLGE